MDDREEIMDLFDDNVKNRFSLYKLKHLILTGLLGFILGIVFVVVFVVKFNDIFLPSNPEDNTPDVVVIDDDDDYTLTISTVQDILKPTAGLITNQYHYTGASIYEDYEKWFNFKVPLTTTKAVFTYKGTISLGFDINDVKYSIDNDSKRITITLPSIGILANDLDLGSFEFPYEQESPFNEKDMKDYVEVIDQLKDKQAKLVLADKDYMETVLNNTKSVIKEFLSNSEFTAEYQVKIIAQNS